MNIYIDEAGDLGFSKGASKYFVISFLATDFPKYIKRVIKQIKIKYKIPANVELKAYKSYKNIKIDLLSKLSNLNIEIFYICLNKDKVNDRLRKDTNILYNYMTNLLLVPYLEKSGFKNVSIIVDLRITKVAKGMRFDDYLKYKLLFEKDMDIDLYFHHIDSKQSNIMVAIDFISNSIFRKYERKDFSGYNLIKNKIIEANHLFF